MNVHIVQMRSSVTNLKQQYCLLPHEGNPVRSTPFSCWFYDEGTRLRGGLFVKKMQCRKHPPKNLCACAHVCHELRVAAGNGLRQDLVSKKTSLINIRGTRKIYI